MTSDTTTELSLKDTIALLASKNKEWERDPFSCKIFALIASVFKPEHSDTICKENCPELLELCKEYREKNTFFGLPIDANFIDDAFTFLFPPRTIEVKRMLKTYLKNTQRFGSAPVRYCHFRCS